MSDLNDNAAAASAFRPGALGRVVRAAENSAPRALSVKPREELTTVGYDERWPGYVLCGTVTGQSGWLPEAALRYVGPGMAIARPDYAAVVLPVSVGDQLTLHTEANGWYWATRPDGQSGWVLAEHVKVLDPD